MAATESYVGLAEDGAGKKIDNVTVSTSQGTVQRQVVVLGDHTDSTARVTVTNGALNVTLAGSVTQQFFTDVALNASGQATLTLTSAPSSVKSCVATIRQDKRSVAVTALSGSALTVQVRKLQYERATLGDTSAQNAPAGVTIRNTSGGVTATPAAGTDAAAVNAIGGAGNATNRASYDAHTHVFNNVYNHGHSVTQTFTDIAVAASETVDILVTYQ